MDVIPISRVKFDDEDEQALLEVLRSGLLAQGPKVVELESSCASLIGASNVVAYSNGTTALAGALAAAGVGPGTDVITSSFTFGATINTALMVGARVHLVDISLDDFSINIEEVQSVGAPEGSVLMPVHLFGQTGDLRAISEIRDRNGWRIVEDAAQAIGAGSDGISVGTIDLAAFSLYATKNITTGEGGLVSTNSSADADFLRKFRNQGMSGRYEYDIVGMNYRLTDLAAVLGIRQVKRYCETIARRSWIARQYCQALSGIKGVIAPRCMPGRNHVWHQFVILFEDQSQETRDEIVQKMFNEGITCGVYYPRALSEYRVFLDHPRVKVVGDQNARLAGRSSLALPISHHLSDNEVETVAEKIVSVLS